jgi:hypothetical protein
MGASLCALTGNKGLRVHGYRTGNIAVEYRTPAPEYRNLTRIETSRERRQRRRPLRLRARAETPRGFRLEQRKLRAARTAFERKQMLLPLNPTGIPRQLAISAHHAVTRHDDRNRIAPVRSAHGAR